MGFTKNIRRALIGLAIAGFGAQQAAAAELSFVRDAEIEALLRDYSTPIFEAAGVAPDSVRLFLVQDDSFNAFVAGGRNMVFHTGLLEKTEGPAELMGVIAHETGHIAGNHLIRRADAERSAYGPLLLSYILGVAAVAAGSGDVGMATISGGQHAAQRALLAYSRGEESAADQAAATYLERVQVDPAGMLAVLNRLKTQEVIGLGRVDPYTLTHPVSDARKGALEARVHASAYLGKADDPALIARHARMRAKLHGFLDRPAQTFAAYPPADQSALARYARAIAYFKQPDPAKAVAEIDALLATAPNDPYYWELKGQILLETGDAANAAQAYRKALDFDPAEPQFAVGLASALLASTKDDGAARQARDALRDALRRDPLNAGGWRLMSIAQSRLGDDGAAALATAETLALRGELDGARVNAERASGLLPTGSPDWLRAQDLLALAKRKS